MKPISAEPGHRLARTQLPAGSSASSTAEAPISPALFITRKWPPATGGMETYSVELCRELAEMLELSSSTLPGRADGSPPGALKLTAFFIQSLLLLMRHRNRWRLVHFGDFVLFPLAWVHAKLAPDIPRVITIHGRDITFGRGRGWKASLYRRFVRWAQKRRYCLDRIIVNSRNTARLVKQAGLGDSTVIPLGVRMSEQPQFPIQPIAPDNRYVLFVGRLVQRKGAAWFAREVMPLLPSDVQFVVVGQVWDKEEARLLREQPRTALRGRVTDTELNQLRAGAAAVVMPNIPSLDGQDVEGFGIAALEAAAAGAPLLAADLQGLADAVIDGVTGYLLEPEQPECWIDKVNDLLSWSYDRRLAYAQRARARVAEEFSWARVAADTARAYREVIAETCRG